MIGRPKLVLASGSPRRVTLINQAGIEPDALRPADIDETPKRGELPRACANRLARAKAEAALALVRVDEELQGAYILVRRHRGRGRPPHPAEGRAARRGRAVPAAALGPQSPRPHRGLPGDADGGVPPAPGGDRVRFKRLSDEDIESYLASGEWRGKAGGYAAQGIAGSFIVKIVGSYTNVVGLPLYETTTLLLGEGYPIRFGWLNAV